MVDKDFLKKDYSEMTKEELLLAREFEVNMFERLESALMLPDANDETLEMAKPLLANCKKCIAEIDELLGVDES